LVELRETHISWVFLTADRAYKVKKPVRFSYVDYATAERRHAMCRAEVELNRRLAPNVYLGIRALVPAEGGGLVLGAEDDAAAVDHAVEMRRFDERHTLAARIAAGTAGVPEVVAVGAVLARFHAAAPAVAAAGAERIKRVLDDNFASLEMIADATMRTSLMRGEHLAASLLEARWDELDWRAERGRVRDGHGDLRLEHVLLEDAVEVVDCVEFNSDLRRIDVAEDLAFLMMELHAAGRPDLAVALVRAYRQAGGDPGDDRLLAFFAAYRAQVRAKVALTAADQTASSRRRQRASELIRLARRLQWAATTPSVIVIAGVAAAGKSTVAAALAEECGFARVSSDLVRKRRAGVAATERAPDALYDDRTNRETYAAMGEQAQGLASTGVIVDATFRRRADRDAFFRALGDDVPVLVVECRAPLHVLERRAVARQADPRNVSDADRAVVLAQAAAFDALDEIPADRHAIVRTDQPTSRIVELIADAACRLARAAPRRGAGNY
jgi:aminoglycoside phosphotransferase family enzyme/adenylate kinase family enzyme